MDPLQALQERRIDMEKQEMTSFLLCPFPYSVVLYLLASPYQNMFINVNSPRSRQTKNARIPTASTPSGKPTANPIVLCKLMPCEAPLLLLFVDWLGDNTVVVVVCCEMFADEETVVPVCCEMLADEETVVPGTESA
jgi:hypothetical protein